MSTQHANKVRAPTEDTRISVTSRPSWAQYVPAAFDSEQATARMIQLAASEFIRHRGARTIQVVVEHANGSRLMVWRGYEEIAVEQVSAVVADNSGYVSRSRRPVIQAHKTA